ncbi:MAG: hypothetical protein JJE04_02200, partial [Acidobacteriia bacterium]|nr:hypothetical protein [Terriglobia bacterium]
MCCSVHSLLVFLLLAPALLAQRAQLGVKGRQQERGPQRKLEAIRKLPRRGKAGAELTFGPTPLQQYLEKQRAALPPPRELSDDRSRPLVRRTPARVPPSPLATLSPSVYFPLPRKLEGDPGYIAGLPAAFVTPPPPATDPAVPNRWRIGLPHWSRYENQKLDDIYTRPRWWDPFNLNTLKGDYPIIGRKTFFNFTGSSDTLLDTRRIPVPSVQSAARPGEYDFFGKGEQMLLRQSFRLGFSLFRGSAGFEPVNFELKITPEFNINYARVRENALTRIDVRQGTRRTDTNIGMQELYFEKRLFTNSSAALRPKRDVDDRGSAYYDFTSLRVGIQRFTSDFRGFIFSDEQPGARLFGTLKNNIFQYNLAYFNMLEKDTNSGLNRWRQRNQSVYAANLYWNDFLTHGYNVNFSLLYNNDQPTFHIDKNGFLVRPAPIGFPRPHKIRAGYAGFSSDGHIGRYNFAHAVYYAFGRDDLHPIPANNQAQNIQAYLGAAELAYERDWAIYKVSFFMTSGDNDLDDGKARGFDGIVPNQQFAGGGFLGNAALADRGLLNNAFEGGGTNYLNRQFVPLT